MGVADVKTDGKGRARCAPAGLGDHGRVGIDPYHPSLRPYFLGEAAHLVPKTAACVQNLIPRRHRADVEHAPLNLPGGAASAAAGAPAE